jgi:hypothetical protein
MTTTCFDHEKLVAKGKCTWKQTQGGKEILHETVSLLVGLIKSISPDRLGEGPLAYRASTGTQEQEQEQEQAIALADVSAEKGPS